MDRAATIAAIGGMLGTFAENVPDETWDVVLARSVIPDTAGRWPGSAGYVDSYDPEWAAAELVSIRIDQTMTSSETSWSVGMTCGRVTALKMLNRSAPSTCAASFTSSGTD